MARTFGIPIACALAAMSLSPGRAASLSVPAWIEAEKPVKAPRFEATLNGKQAAVNSQLGPGSDQVILVVMDVTGDSSLVDPARQALSAAIRKLPHNSWVGLMRAQDGLHVIADPEANRHPILNGIENVPNSGNPGLLDTVQSAMELADAVIRKAPVRVAVLYITDSNIYNYREDFTNPVINQSDPHDLSRRFPGALVEEKISKLIDSTSPLEAPLFIVHLNDRGDTLNRVYENGLQTLANATGGRADLCRSVAEIPEAIAGIFERISNGWRLILNIPPKVHGGAQVRLNGHSGDEELRLSWRSHLEAKVRQNHAGETHSNRSRRGP
jgi:hypothetical protein